MNLNPQQIDNRIKVLLDCYILDKEDNYRLRKLLDLFSHKSEIPLVTALVTIFPSPNLKTSLDNFKNFTNRVNQSAYIAKERESSLNGFEISIDNPGIELKEQKIIIKAQETKKDFFIGRAMSMINIKQRAGFIS